MFTAKDLEIPCIQVVLTPEAKEQIARYFRDLTGRPGEPWYDGEKFPDAASYIAWLAGARLGALLQERGVSALRELALAALHDAMRSTDRGF
jgi:hypothetical protein